MISPIVWTSAMPSSFLVHIDVSIVTSPSLLYNDFRIVWTIASLSSYLVHDDIGIVISPLRFLLNFETLSEVH